MPTEVTTLRVVDIEPNPLNPRKNFNQAALEELAASIKEVGVLQPVVVTPLETPEGQFPKYMLVAGERRWRACQLAGEAFIPAIVEVFINEAQMTQIMLIENLQREDLDPIEEATALHALVKDHGWKQTELARKLGVSQSHIANRIRLLRLPEAMQQSISAGIIPASTAKELVAYEGMPEVLEEVSEKAKKGDMEGSEILQEVRNRAWNETRPLHRKSAWPEPEFNVKECEKCPKWVQVMYPWDHGEGKGKKFPRCTDSGCWDEKQKAAQKAAAEQRRREAIEKAKAQGQEIDEGRLISLNDLKYNDYEAFDSNCKFDPVDCEVCDKKTKALSWADEICEICLDPPCFEKKQKVAQAAANKEERAAKKEHATAVDRIISITSVPWDRQLLLYLAGQMVYMPPSLFPSEWTRSKITKAIYQKYGWEEKEGLYGDNEKREILKNLRTLPDAELYRIIVFCLVKPVDKDDVFFTETLADWQPSAAEAPEEEKSPAEVWADQAAKLTDEEVKRLGIERALGQVANGWIEKQIAEAIDRGEDAAKAAKKAIGVGGGHGGVVGFDSFSAKGLKITSADGRSFEVTWREVADYVKSKMAEQGKESESKTA